MTRDQYSRFANKMQISSPPAVVIGGPPHSGKSVLAYSLSQALRRMEVDHYLLRAYPPDGEGDWFQEGPRAHVEALRRKGARSEAWLAPLRRDLARRPLPFLVDMGGRPTERQEAILADCTHAIILTPDDASRRRWATRFARYRLSLLADLRSDLHGENRLDLAAPVLVGVLAGLERGRRATGPAFEALVARLADLFSVDAEVRRRHHLETAPVELAVDVVRLARRLGENPHRWRPHALPAVLSYLPSAKPLALYGRGPNWLYAAVAVHALPASFHLFDVRLGWVAVPNVSPSAGPRSAGSIVASCVEGPGATHWMVTLPEAYLPVGVPLPRLAVAEGRGVVISGKLPLWMWAALARGAASASAAWIAVHVPQLRGDVVVASRAEDVPVGSVRAALTAR